MPVTGNPSHPDQADRQAGFRLIIDLLRVRQWIKNGFVFIPIVFSGELFFPGKIPWGMVVFSSFCLVSSSAYIVNDLFDLKNDRVHPEKRSRPIARGAFPAGAAILVSLGLAIAGVALGFAASPVVGGILLFYLLLNMLYSHTLKRMFLIDVFSISLGFVARILAGAAVTSVPPTKWLLLMTFFLALFLALGKRRSELLTLGETASSHREVFSRYSVKTLDQIIVSLIVMIIVTFSLFTLSEHVIVRFHTENLFFTVPLVVYGLFRYLHLIHDLGKGGDPTELLVADRPLLFAVLLWVGACVLIIYGRPG